MTRLNLGCGEFPMKGFVNIDVYDGPGIDKVANIVNLPYEDNSIDEIYAGHVIEHLTMKEAKKALKEWLRVLKPLSKIGIIIPDKNKTPPHLLNGEKFPKEPYKEHHSYWNLEFLKQEVENAGFEEVEEINIETYPHLVARPNWQSGITAIKGGGKMKEKKEEIEIPKFNPLEESWCKNEKKIVYNPKKKRHCPNCRRLL